MFLVVTYDKEGGSGATAYPEAIAAKKFIKEVIECGGNKQEAEELLEGIDTEEIVCWKLEEDDKICCGVYLFPI